MFIYTPLSFIYQICKPYRKWYILTCLAPIYTGVYCASSNYIIKIIIDTITGDIINYTVFIKPLILFLTIELLMRLFWSLHDYAEYKLQGNVFRDIIIKPYQYLQNHSYEYFQNNFSGSIVSKMKSISDCLYQFWDNVSHRILENLSIIVVNIIVIGLLSKHLMLPILIYVIIIGTMCYFQSKKYDKYAFELKSNYHYILGKLSDKISNIMTIFTFSKKHKETQELFDFYHNTQTPAFNKLNYFNYITWIITGLINTLMMILIFLYAIYLRKHNIIDTGTLAVTILVVLSCCGEIYSLVNNVLALIQNLADFRAAIDGIFIPQEIIDKPNALDLKVIKGEIVFKDLSFNYEGNKTVFQNLSFHIKAGEKVGIVRHSGAGKSTLVSL